MARSKSGFWGVYPMVYALFDKDERLSRELMRAQIRALLRHKVHGIAVLGLASEVNKLSTAERRTLLAWAAEDIGGEAPLAVTIAEPSVHGQIEFIRAAAELGAKWAILQPPHVKSVRERELVRFFGAVAEGSPILLGIQNAPEYLGVGLSNAGLKEINAAHPNVAIVKVEATAIAIGRLIEETEDALDVFNGRGGVEITDSLRAGAVGCIPGAEVADLLVRLFERMASGSKEGEAEADRIYAELLPLLVVLGENMDTFLAYGKAVMGHRLGIDGLAPRAPFTPPTAFGLSLIRRYAEKLGPL
jgi:4-hydroxy-tetrahydrodipicolinate synthase